MPPNVHERAVMIRTMKHTLKFDDVLSFLQEQQRVVVEKLRATRGDSALLETKRQLDSAIRCLNFCESHQIDPDSEVFAIPYTRNEFDDFFIVNVYETNDISHGDPVTMSDGRPVTLGAGDLLVWMRR